MSSWMGNSDLTKGEIFVSPNEKLESLERKFALVKQEIEEKTTEIEVVVGPLPVELAEVVESPTFEMSQLKSDFQIVRQNILKLVSTGQRILDSASVIDVSDMNAKQLEALSMLQTTIGTNLKTMMEIYKDIMVIEKAKKGMASPPPTQPGSVNNGTINNIVFQGSTLDLLDSIRQHKKEIEVQSA